MKQRPEKMLKKLKKLKKLVLRCPKSPISHKWQQVLKLRRFKKLMKPINSKRQLIPPKIQKFTKTRKWRETKIMIITLPNKNMTLLMLNRLRNQST